MSLVKPSSGAEHVGEKRALSAVVAPPLPNGLRAPEGLFQLDLARREQDPEASIPPLLHVSSKGKIVWASSPARRLLHAYWGWTDTSAKLPPALRRMLCRRSSEGASSPTQPGKDVVMVGRHGASLSVRLIEDNGRLWFLLDERSVPLNGMPLQAHGLTKREAEVMQWLAAGKSNKDIGTILAISPRTVEKHLARIFEHLGVETRTAAAACYLLSQQAPDSVAADHEEATV